MEDDLRSAPSQAGRAAGRGSRLRKVALCLAALPASLLLAEATVRVLGLQAMPLPEGFGGTIWPVADPLLLFENRPDGKRVITYRDAHDAAPHVVEHRTNSQRFRGPEVAHEKPPGVLRIACLGDSHTFGYGVPEGETWPDHLRSLADHARCPVEVMNCGVNAYGTLQEVLWFERRVAEFDPDVVLLQYFVNDVAIREGMGKEKDALFLWTHPRREGWIRTLRSYSRALDVLCDAIFRRRMLDTFAPEVMVRYADDSPGWIQVQDGLRRLREACERRGARLHVLLYPFLYERDGVFTSHEPLQLVAAFCAHEGIPCFDGEPALLELEGDLRVSPLDYHANGRAHRAFAEAAAKYLAAEGLPFRIDAPE